MHDEDPEAGAEEAPVSRMESALEVVETFRDELAALLHEVRRGETARAKRLVPVIMELSRAVGALAKEAQHADDARHKGARGAGEFDLDAARAEIERRLARLRAAADGGEFSGGADGA